MRHLISSLLIFITISNVNGSWQNLDDCSPLEKREILKRSVFTDPAHFPPLYQAAHDLQQLFELAGIRAIGLFGATLGILRFGEALPWDDDIDYGIKDSEEAKLKTLIPLADRLGYNLFPDDIVGYKFYRKEPLVNLATKEEHQVFVDIFLYKPEADNYVLVRDKGRSMFPKSYLKKEELETRTVFQCGPLTMPCSTYAKNMLRRAYGEDCATQARFYFSHTRAVPICYHWTINPADDYPTYKGITLQNRVEGLSLVPPSPALPCDESKDLVYRTTRLIACPATPARIVAMADILNQDNDGKLNGQFYEDGKLKGADWIAHKQDLIFRRAVTKCIFFYAIESNNEIACVVGREPDFETTTTQRLFYLTNVKYQKKGLTAEAIRGFLEADTLIYDLLELSIHPENTSSIAVAVNGIGAIKTKEGHNNAGTQPRHFYAISAAQLRDQIANRWVARAATTPTLPTTIIPTAPTT